MNTEKISNAVAELREAAGDGSRERRLLDALFRDVHSLKAKALANGLSSLAAAAHEFENVLHALRTGNETPVRDAVPANVWNSLKQEQKHTLQQAVAEGARLFLVKADFDVKDFDKKFQALKETLRKTGEVISTSVTTDKTHPGNITFRILYAQANDQVQVPHVTVEQISLPRSAPTANHFLNLQALESAFEKLSAELAGLPPVPFGDVFEQAIRAGQVTALATGKEVEFELRGDLKLDKALCETIGDPLVHLVRNAVDHGIEAPVERVKLGKNPRGKIVIEVASDADRVRITLTDDGRGIDPALIEQIFRPGFSTAAEISEVSGRGVGLDAVKTGIEDAGGSITVRSSPGLSSTFELTLKR